MGKKKSVVLMTLITIVLLVLCAIVAFPKITLPGSGGIKKWNPTVMQYDLGAEFDGGHYAYYYPNGVITEAQYEALDAKEQENYKQHEDTNLYLSTDEDDCIFTSDDKENVAEGFNTAFNKAVELITDRFAERAKHTGSTYRVAVVDDYAVKVELSATENSEELTSADYAYQAFSQYANLGEVSFEKASSDSSTGASTTEIVDELNPQKRENPQISDVIKSVSVKTQYKIAYIRLTFTSLGKEMLETFKNGDATSLNMTIGGETVLQITKDHITAKNEVEYGVRYEEEILYADTLNVLIHSAMEKGGVYINDNDKTPFEFTVPTQNEMRTYAPVYGDNLVWVYLAILAVIVAISVISIVKMGGFGVMNVYASVSYLVITALCFAFITGGVFVFNVGSIFTFLVGLALVNVLNVYIYKAIKAESATGKTIPSSVKGGYKKTIATVVDTYAVLLLGALALLIGVASLYTVACQAIICVLSGAFCNLLWGRVINVMLLSASNDKYKYFRFVREDDEDDE